MSDRVVITGLGVVSSLGIGRETFWKNLLAGNSGISPVTSFDTSNHFTHNGGEVRQFDPHEFLSEEEVASLCRASQLALAAARLAVNDSRLGENYLSTRTSGVCLGTTVGATQTIEAINDQILATGDAEDRLYRQLPTHTSSAAVASAFHCSGPVMMISTACAAGNYAIGHGADIIRAGRADIVIAGGTEPFSRIAFTGFNQFSAVAPERCQPFDKNRKGMMVAEGAGILILESLESAISRNAFIYAEILGYGLSCDAHHMTTPSTDGISACMLNALQLTGIQADTVDYISAHGTGTVANDKNESAAIHAVFSNRGSSIPVSSIKSMLGHTMGAASALEAIACALALQHDTVPPTINFETPDPECAVNCVPNIPQSFPVNIVMNNAYAFGGNNASVILGKYSGQGDMT